MAEQVRDSHVVATDDTIMPMLRKEKCANARMWVYVGDEAHPYNVFDFTLSRGRDGPKYFLKDYNQVLLADGYGGYNGVVAGNGIVRAGCRVGEDVSTLAPHRPGRAEFPQPVPHGRDSLPTVYW